MEKKVDVNSFFSSIAERYDKLNTILSFNVDRSWRKKAIQICRLKTNDKVLDLCCGTGMMIDNICKEVGRDEEVVGLDLNEEMLKVGRKRMEQALKGYKYRLVQGNVLDLPFEDSSFDCITIAFGLRNAPDKDKALSEMYRVLKPGGRLVCLELSKPEVPVFKQIYNVYFNFILPVVGYIGTKDKRAYEYLRDSVNGFLKKNELKVKFQKTGFKDAGFKSLTMGTASIHYGTK